MPTLNTIWLPPPQGDDDLEELVLSYFSQVWQGAQRNGRRGQRQHGVDVFGQLSEGGWSGAQVKARQPGKQLTENEVQHEVELAKGFSPSLRQLIFVTSAYQDAALQELARRLTDQHAPLGLFGVEVWGWQTFISRLAAFPDIIQRHYPQLFAAAAASGAAALVGGSDRGADGLALADVTTVPHLPPHHIPRAEELRTAASYLRDGVAAARDPFTAVALVGVPGSGKSVLAAAVSRDVDVRAAFPDGVVWLTVGRRPSNLSLHSHLTARQAQLAAALGNTTSAFAEPATGRQLLARLLRQKRCLVVLDDIWDTDSLHYLCPIDTGSAALITTRTAEVARAVDAATIQVAELDDAKAVSLFSSWAGNPKRLSRDFLAAVVELCHRLPLILAVAGAAAQRSGLEPNQLLNFLRQNGPTGVSHSLLSYPFSSFDAALSASLAALGRQSRRACLELSVFAQSRAVPEPVVSRYWCDGGLKPTDVERTLWDLIDHGLVQRREETIVVHDAVMDHISRRTANASPFHDRIVSAYFRRGSPRLTNHPGTDRYVIAHLVRHMVAARRIEEAVELLCDYQWISRHVETGLFGELLGDFDVSLAARESDELSSLRAALLSSVHIWTEDRAQLVSQLHHRLRPHRDRHRLRRLLEKARSGAPWLRSISGEVADLGTLLRTYRAARSPVTTLAASEDGATVAAGTDQGHLYVWDAGGTDMLFGAVAHTQTTALAMSADGQTLISGGADGLIHQWRASDRAIAGTIARGVDRVVAVGLTTDAKTAFSVAADGVVRTFDLAVGRESRSFQLPLPRPIALASLSSSGHLIVGVSGDAPAAIQVWDVRDAAQLGSVALPSAPVAVHISDDGRYGLVSCKDHKLFTLEITVSGVATTAPKLVHDWAYEATSVAITPDGGRVLFTRHDKLKLIASDKSQHEFPDDFYASEWFGGFHAPSITAMAVTRDGARCITAAEDGTVQVWRVPTSEPPPRQSWALTLADHFYKIYSADLMVHDFDVPCWATSTVFVDSKHRVAFSSANPVVGFLWIAGNSLVVDINARRPANWRNFPTYTGEVIYRLTAAKQLGQLIGAGVSSEKGVGTAIHYDIASNRLGLHGESELVAIWDIRRKQMHRGSGRQGACILSIASTPEGKRLVTGSSDGCVAVWEVQRAMPRRVFEIGTLDGPVRAVGVLSDARYCVAGGGDERLHVYDLVTRKRLHSFGLGSPVRAIGTFAAKQAVVCGTEDGQVVVVNLANRTVHRLPVRHRDKVMDVDVSPDDKWLVTGGWDKRLQLWDAEALVPITAFDHEIPFMCCAVNSSGSVSAGDAIGNLMWFAVQANDCAQGAASSRRN